MAVESSSGSGGKQGYKNAVVESDSINLISMLKGEKDIRELATQVESIEFAFVPRTCNRAVHSVASFVNRMTGYNRWGFLFFEFLFNILTEDVNSAIRVGSKNRKPKKTEQRPKKLNRKCKIGPNQIWFSSVPFMGFGNRTEPKYRQNDVRPATCLTHLTDATLSHSQSLTHVTRDPRVTHDFLSPFRVSSLDPQIPSFARLVSHPVTLVMRCADFFFFFNFIGYDL
ncbi:hypothetical protein DVH24_026417 [Malus domestica]|uniref:RNase H type-1 domain-containing protein n=1 Tax=Malus domestica TaxID=3750 RepID=A0A498KJC0_MALDO|nr:hypothetical protein DVH24_026417 [Malus domestica]